MPEGLRPEGMVKCPRGAKTREPKLEKGKERKLKRNVKKENKCNFISNIEETVR